MLAELYGKIGMAGVALVFVAIACVYLAVKNIVYLWLVGADFHRIAEQIEEETAEERNIIIEANLKNPLIGIINDILKTHGEHSDDIKSEIAFLFHHYLRKPIRDITLIKVIAAISPLLGLLGTLLGLMGVFGKLSASAALATSTILAAGIWEAIYTTVMGLTIAIPALIAYHVLTIYIRSFNLETVEYSHRFLGNSHYCMSRHNKRRKTKPVKNKKTAGAKSEI
jgi:biopolymer transport protein ExbB